MSNNLKLLIVAIISFSLGVVATNIYSLPAHYEKDRKLVAKILLEKKMLAERKPFFTNVKESGKKVIQALTTPKVTSPEIELIDSQSDYLKLSEQLDKFSDRLSNELKKKYKTIPLNSKDPREISDYQRLKGFLENKFVEKELWYKSSFIDDLSQSKMVMLFKFYNCKNKPPRPDISLIDTCYRLQLFNFREGMWFESDVSSQAIGFLWKDDVPFVEITLRGIGNFSTQTNALFALIPVPDEQMPMQYMKYEAGKIVWQAGSEVRWISSSEKEIDNFETMVHRRSTQVIERSGQ
ncbi:MAG: hypothetical protein H7177_10815 [Rhizobacter sp.]|nr:hypothetical protein [Bacteriovorax sp.]